MSVHKAIMRFGNEWRNSLGILGLT